MQKCNFINGSWVEGAGTEFTSLNPATSKVLWQGNEADTAQCNEAINAARSAFPKWMGLTLEQREKYLEKFVDIIKERHEELTEALSQETGKPLWEAKTEIAAMFGKFEVSKQAYADRCKELRSENKGITSITRHKPHGVVFAIGPYNFPAHIPNGHLMPALLAGNTVVFKPSELVPSITIKIIECWEQAGLPAGVINLLQGSGNIAKFICQHSGIDGIYFTGSSDTGYKIQDTLHDFPQRIIALEMGGNNPLVVHEPEQIEAAVYNTILSAFITAGQRCTCARRLIMVKSNKNENFLEQLLTAVKNIKVGPYTDVPEPFMGPIINNIALDNALAHYDKLIKLGAKILTPLRRLDDKNAFLSPGIIDVTSIENRKDEEVFGPLLSVIWVKDFAAAILEANNTNYGLFAGLLGGTRENFDQFYQEVRAGLVNWNRPSTGASSSAPFGGVGRSGNYRPSAYYAADYCSYPVACLEQESLELPAELSPGITL